MAKEDSPPVKPGPKSVNLGDIACQMNKECGPGTVITGRELVTDPPRIPTGVFAVDYMTGGGLPVWATTCFWGPDSGGKTTLAINAMATAQDLCWRCYNLRTNCICGDLGPRLLKSVWLDVEGTFDRDWASAIGADPDRYILALADYGEQYVNIAERVLRADDAGLVVIDSLAALVPSAEFDAAAEDQFMASQARMIGRMVRQLKQRLIRERKRDHPCAVLFVNQMRVKLGQMFGNPETMSGGFALKHEFSLLLRTVKKSLAKEGTDKKYVDSKHGKNTADRFSVTIRKAKVQTLAGIGEYVRLTEAMADLGLHKGQVDDYSTLMNYAKTYGVVEKVGAEWRYFNYKARTLDQIRQVWVGNLSEKIRTQRMIVEHAKERLASGGEESTEGQEETD